jgi:glutathione-regulated potassium-efflux system protein KefB
VVLLLFIIGLELSPKRLWVMRKSVFGVGLGAGVCSQAWSSASVALLGFGQPLNSAVVLGLGLALSSTAFGLQSLAERKELNAPHGQPGLRHSAVPGHRRHPADRAGAHARRWRTRFKHPATRCVTACKSSVASRWWWSVGRYLLRPVFRIVAKTKLQEVSTATALLVVIGTAWLMDLVGVSMALGAFLAGLLLADSDIATSWNRRSNPSKVCCWVCSSSVSAWAPISACCSIRRSRYWP